MSFLFRDQSSPQLGEYLKKRTLLILPIGTTEEHGPHMPVDTDARIAEAYGTQLAAALVPEMPVLLLDTIRYGYSLKIMRQWPGTIIIRSRVFMDMVFDLCRSLLDMGFEKLAILDCHGGHGGPLNTVSRELCDATDKAVAIINPFVMARDEFNAARKSAAGGHSTAANLKPPLSSTLARRSWICRRRQMLTTSGTTLILLRGTTAWASSGRPGLRGTFSPPKRAPMAIPLSPPPRWANSSWTPPLPTGSSF